MNIDQLGRDAAADLASHTSVDTAAALRELRRLRARRNVERAVAVVAAFVVASAAVGLAAARGDHRVAQPIDHTARAHNGLFVSVSDTTLYGSSGGVDYLPSPPSAVETASSLEFTTDGTELFFQNRVGEVVAFRVADGATRVVADCPKQGPCDFGVSPDGRLLAFHDTHGLEVRDLEGGTTRTVPATSDASYPRWSPDGRRIAYVTAHGIYVINPDGSSPRRIYPLTGRAQAQPNMSWSPDSRAIAFMRSDEALDKAGRFVSASYTLMTVRADGSASRAIQRAGTCFCAGIPAPTAAWSPDGRLIAFSRVDPVRANDPTDARPGGLWVVRPDGTGLRSAGQFVVGHTLAWQPKLR